MGRRDRRPRLQELPLPKRPYRDSALLHAVFATVILLFAWLTGGGLGKAAGVAALYFGAATAWSWVRFAQRRRAQDAAARTAADAERPQETG